MSLQYDDVEIIVAGPVSVAVEEVLEDFSDISIQRISGNLSVFQRLGDDIRAGVTPSNLKIIIYQERNARMGIQETSLRDLPFQVMDLATSGCSDWYMLTERLNGLFREGKTGESLGV